MKCDRIDISKSMPPTPNASLYARSMLARSIKNSIRLCKHGLRALLRRLLFPLSLPSQGSFFRRELGLLHWRIRQICDAVDLALELRKLVFHLVLVLVRHLTSK